MTFEEVLDQAVTMLQRRGRVTYRLLKVQFQLDDEQLEALNRFHPLGRNGQARDITETVLFLADEERSGWITGVVLPVDGGVTAGRN